METCRKNNLTMWKHAKKNIKYQMIFINKTFKKNSVVGTSFRLNLLRGNASLFPFYYATDGK